MANIALTNVTKTFGEFTAVDNISAEISDGEFVTLLGPSGCGKTTLLNLMSGFLTPDGGAIQIGGVDVTNAPPEQRDTAMCFQSYALFPHLSVKENIAFGLRQQKLPRKEIEERVTELGRQLGLQAQFAKLPNQLSGGQQQRVALGRSLAVRPSVILFDEPLSNLDAKLRESVRFEIRKIQAEAKLTAIYVTHDQSEALAMSDRIFVMNAGRVEQSGTPREIYNTPVTRFVADFIGAANILEGEVIGSSDNGSWIFDTQIGQLAVECKKKPEAKKHYLCWRPEDAVVAAKPGKGANSNYLEADVSTIAYQGGFTDVFVHINDLAQRIHASGTFEISDQKAKFQIPQDKIRILEPVS